MTNMTLSFKDFLTINGYRDIKDLGDGRWAAIFDFMFTKAIITGRMGDLHGYSDRWCYHDYDAAKTALDAWDGTGEPDGWHRHPDSGRRRQDGREEVWL